MPEYQQALKRMEVDIQLRGMSNHTLSLYKRNVGKFLEFSCKPVEELSEIDVRGFLISLLNKGEVSTKTINLYNSAIRFFFAVTLNRTMNYLQMPRFKTQKKLPTILSREEIQRLIYNCTNLRHQAFFAIAYGSGLRVSEIISLKIKDIDSKSMRVFVRAGKGNKDRFTLLSSECLAILREYWTTYKPKHPEGWLFLNPQRQKYSAKAAEVAFKKWVGKVGISKDVTIHTLRHCFATHLLEDGASVFQIKELMGHASLSSTVVYIHMANTTSDVVSPADRFTTYA